MLLLAAVCGISTVTGYLLQRAEYSAVPITVCFAIAYITGGWFAVQDVWRALKIGKLISSF